MSKNDILSLSELELQRWMTGQGQPAYRGSQLFKWLHQRGAATFDAMSDLPAALRATLAQQFSLRLPQAVRKQTAADGTVKYLFELADRQRVETVAMRYEKGISLCISTQVGCRMGCAFCASTKGGLVRNLTAGEMLGQIYAAEKDLGEPIHSLVLMGIGEPLDNFDEVVRFLQLVSEPGGRGLSKRSISLSTCGIVPAIDELAKYPFGLTLSISMHAATDEARSQIMPVNRRYPLKDLLEAAKRYQKTTGRRISFEYALIAGQNDADADASQLAKALRGIVAHVNLIPVNPTPGTAFTPADAARTEAFRKKLESFGLAATVRRTLGQDISAACGQLRAEHPQ